VRWSWAILMLVACREAGTIEIVPGDVFSECRMAASVSARLVFGERCNQCGCTTTCPVCEAGPDCVDTCGPDTCRVPIAEIDDGRVLEPSKPGAYAVVYEYYDELGDLSAMLCAEVIVEADGTASSRIDAMKTECCPLLTTAD